MIYLFIYLFIYLLDT